MTCVKVYSILYICFICTPTGM